MDLATLAGDYTVRTVVAGAALLGIVSGVLGTFAVLRRQSLLGDALAHAALPGIALGFLVAGQRALPALLAGALASAVAAALLVALLVRRTRLKGDAAIGLALSLFFAVGVILLSFVQGRAGAGQAGLETFLFGQAAAILRSDLWVMAALAGVALASVAALWKEFELVTFDPTYAAALGLPVAVLDVTLTALVAVAVVLGLQLVGVVLMSAMLIAPAVAARQWTHRLGRVAILAALFGAASGVLGATVSAGARGLATGPLIVLALSAFTALSLVVAPTRGLLPTALRRRADRAGHRDRDVLRALDTLRRRHDDPTYAAERGMVDATVGHPTGRTLRALERRGLVERVRHRPEEGRHWRLLEAGEAALERGRDGPDAPEGRA